MTSPSPLRYPGGKSRFTDFIWNAILSSGKQAEVFVEPFCGGAGAAISLLKLGRVNYISLNDVDPLVSSFWSVVFGKSSKTSKDIDWLKGAIESAEFSIAEWRKQKLLKPDSVRAAAWKCLYLNRTSFNGILYKAGPIGGWEQKNRTLDVRFNHEKLIMKIQELYGLRNQVERVGCVNWKKFCSGYRTKSGAYLYLDPPYYHKAEQLYGYLFDEKQHRLMRDYLLSLTIPWMLSYDDASEIRALYGKLYGVDGRVIDQTYSAHPMGGASFVGRELFFSNRKLPIQEVQDKSKQHVGLTVLGGLSSVAPQADGPKRTPISQLELSLTTKKISSEGAITFITL